MSMDWGGGRARRAADEGRDDGGEGWMKKYIFRPPAHGFWFDITITSIPHYPEPKFPIRTQQVDGRATKVEVDSSAQPSGETLECYFIHLPVPQPPRPPSVSGLSNLEIYIHCRLFDDNHSSV